MHKELLQTHRSLKEEMIYLNQKIFFSSVREDLVYLNF